MLRFCGPYAFKGLRGVVREIQDKRRHSVWSGAESQPSGRLYAGVITVIVKTNIGVGSPTAYFFVGLLICVMQIIPSRVL
jgi:hypothetical protein